MDEQRAALLEQTVRFWQARSPRPFTQEDARAAIENVTGFFTTLHRWSTASAVEPPKASVNTTKEAA